MSRYAIIESGGKQYRVSQGDVLRLEKLNAKPGEAVRFDRVLAIGEEGGELRFGRPWLSDGVVSAEVVSHGLDPKVRTVKLKRRKRYRRHYGHRQRFTAVLITDIGMRPDEAAASPDEAAAND